jgi:hypothetical protein
MLHFGGGSHQLMKMISLRALLLCLCTALPTLAQAQMADVGCDDSARMILTLKEVMGAERQGMGLRDPETMLEVWVTARNGDWLIVQTYANGTSCIIAMGEHWDAGRANPA